MDNLSRYRSKRNFARTEEPRGKIGQKFQGRFIIQKHAARRLHFDFRLEWDGVLKSWAIPKGPSLNPEDKRLAVQVEDHPIEYGDFEGTIPKGEYGGGVVMLWDRGKWEPIGDVQKSLNKGHLEFLIHGAKLHGRFHLIRLKGRANGNGSKTNWLLVKGDDDYSTQNGEIPSDADRSVVSKRSMTEIAEDKKSRQWHSNKSVAENIQKGAVKPPAPKKASPVKSQKKQTAPPAFIPPQLALRAFQAPTSAQWIHEMKFDGYRMGTRIQSIGKERTITLLTRSGLDWTGRFPSLAKEISKLDCVNAYLDGEIVIMDKMGISNFSMLQDALSQGNDKEMKYFFFDLLYLDGEDLRSNPLLDRKVLLAGLLPKKNRKIFYSEHYEISGADFYKAACELTLEGIISKNKNAPYSGKRNGSWIKTKCLEQEEFIVGGYTISKSKKGIGAFLVGHYEEEKLVYDGRVGTGLKQKQSEMLEKELQQKRIPHPLLTGLRTIDKRKAFWVKPELVIEVKYTGRSSDGLLRHASLINVREDKPPKEITKEEVLASPKIAHASKGVAGINISHAERIIDPTTGATKGDLVQYYMRIASLMLPEIAKRPLSLIRCPDGIEGQKFFQRHPQKGLNHILDITDPKDGEKLVAVKDEKGLINLIQFSVIEIHPWEGTVQDLSRADRMIFDLDPDPSVSYADVVKAAIDLRERLKEMGLKSLVKLSGGKGIHVVVPLLPIEWEQLKGISRAIVQQMEKDEPDRFTSAMSKSKRKGKIFIDYLRNDRGSTAIGIFSARARPGLPIAMPLNWRQLKPSLEPTAYSIRSQNLKMPDEWKEISKIKQRFSAKIIQNLRLKN